MNDTKDTRGGIAVYKSPERGEKCVARELPGYEGLFGAAVHTHEQPFGPRGSVLREHVYADEHAGETPHLHLRLNFERPVTREQWEAIKADVDALWAKYDNQASWAHYDEHVAPKHK